MLPIAGYMKAARPIKNGGGEEREPETGNRRGNADVLTAKSFLPTPRTNTLGKIVHTIMCVPLYNIANLQLL